MLEEMPPPANLDLDAVMDWALQRPSLPRQVNYHSGFGHPPLVVYEEPRFYAELLVWFPSRTSTHGHGFLGAFVVVAGYSIEAQYEFREGETAYEGIKSGLLEPRSIEFIQPGKVNRILGGDGFIHTVGHMGNPSLTLVIRTESAGATRQYSYFPNGVGIDVFLREQTLSRQADMLRALARARPAAFVERVWRFIEAGDEHRWAMTLHLLEDELREHGGREVLVARATDRFGDVAERIAEAWAQQGRSRKIWNGLTKLAQPEIQLEAGLRDLFPKNDDLHAIIAQTFPDAAPEETLREWRRLAREQAD